jgi:endonuclease-3
MKKADKQKVIEILANLYPEAKPALIYSTPFELLVAVILSAQCTDERVNKVTKVLFEKYNTPQAICSLSQTELEGYVFSCGLYRSKAAHILSAARDILDKFDAPLTIKKD